MPTYAANVLPDATGRTLGSDPQRWNAYLLNLDLGGVSILVGLVDPSADAGVSAAQGSLYLRTNGSTSTTLYVKTGPADTNWTAK